MILSKPLICHHQPYLVTNRIIFNVILKHFSKLSYNQHNQSIIRRPNIKFNNKKILTNQTCFNRKVLIFRREFMKPPNSMANHNKQSVVLDLLGIGLMLFCNLYILSFLIDLRYIWHKMTPSYIHDNVENMIKEIKKWSRENLYKKADSLAASESPNQNEDKAPGKIHESGLVRNLLAVFNFAPEDSKSDGFRNKRIIEYENRIRLYSNPEKIFRYFATVKIIYGPKDSEVYMTPDDFLRALTPGIKQPDGLGLDQYKVVDLTKSKEDYKNENLKNDSIFYKLSKNGLINFTDFLFLLTVISVSPRNFEIAFRMFDLNGDGEVEYEEFAKVQNAILAQTTVGKKMGKAIKYKGVSSAVSKYFFGNDLKQRLTIDHFINFQATLQKELLTLEFERKNPDTTSQKIREVDFAELLVAYALFPEKKRKRMNQRVMNKFGNNHSIGISLDDYLYFFRFLQHINDVDIALAIYHIAGASIDQATLKHVAKTVAHVELTDHLVDVVFTIFDDDEDGQLSHKEFIAIMKERLRRGLSKPKDTGFFTLMSLIWKSLISFDF